MQNGEIRAVYTQHSIRVYQAYSDFIVDDAIKNGRFGAGFKMERMTWIKTSFLWMMYRCGWAEKKGQERVLAIDIKRESFDYLAKNAVISSYSMELKISKEEWKKAIASSDIRCQWDPERDIYGNPLKERAIQIGIRGKVVNDYVNRWILKMTDITDYVHELNHMRLRGENILDLLPDEKIYEVTCRKNSDIS